jgi:hypothetical protein
MAREQALELSDSVEGVALTVEQKRFKDLRQQLEKLHAKKQAWQTHAATYRHTAKQALKPVLDTLVQAQKAWILALDAALDRPGFTKKERAFMCEILCEEISGFISNHGPDDVLKALYNKHSDHDFGAMQQDLLQTMKRMVEEVTGADLGEAVESQEELMARVLARAQAMKTTHAAAQEAREAMQAAHASTRRQTAAEKKNAAAAQEATQSVREIYRQLASALHPDRESDDAKRRDKTELMQRANAAYADNDLFTLLELQLQTQAPDTNSMAKLSSERVLAYCKIFWQQIKELKAQLQQTELNFRVEFQINPGLRLDPTKLSALTAQIAREMRLDIQHLEAKIALSYQASAFKPWLKDQIMVAQSEAMEGWLF